MASSIIARDPSRRNVAQTLKDHRFLHAYSCVRCGRECLWTAWQAARYTHCTHCRRMKHGHTTNTGKSAIYSVWRGIITRCEDANYPRRKDYGGRGISVCSEWHDFETFLLWSKSVGWKRGMQIDRIDNDGNYCPENCRIVTPKVNMQNSRRAKLDKESVRCIRMLRWSGVPSRIVADIFGVNRETVNGILRWKSWNNV